MFLKNSYFFDCFPRRKTHNRNSKVATLVTWGLVFILLLTVISLAFIPGGELFEYDDLPFTESNTAAWAIMPFPIISSSSFELGIFAMILFFEYLRSHIGEKRFAGWMMELNNSSFFAFLGRLFIEPSFLVFLPCLWMPRRD